MTNHHDKAGRATGETLFESGKKWAYGATTEQRRAMLQCKRECDAQAHRPPPAWPFGCILDAVIVGSPSDDGSDISAFSRDWFGCTNPSLESPTFHEVLEFMAGALIALTPDRAFVAGKQWATTAEPEQLEEMVQLRSLARGPDWGNVILTAHGYLHVIADAVFPEGWDRHDLEDFGDEWLDAQQPTKEEVRSFIEGATSRLE